MTARNNIPPHARPAGRLHPLHHGCRRLPVSPRAVHGRPGHGPGRRPAADHRLLHRQRRAADHGARPARVDWRCSSWWSPATRRRTPSCWCWAAGSATRTGASGCSSTGIGVLHADLAAVRDRPVGHHPRDRAGAAGRLGRTDGAADAVDDPGDRYAGIAVQGARLVRRHRRARGRHRPAARRRAGVGEHRRQRLACHLLRQHPGRHHRTGPGRPLRAGDARGSAYPASTSSGHCCSPSRSSPS